jgi:hypothetical protein
VTVHDPTTKGGAMRHRQIKAVPWSKLEDDSSTLRRLVRDVHMPIVVHDDRGQIKAVLLPIKAADSVEDLLFERTGGFCPYFSDDCLRGPDAWEVVQFGLDRAGMVRLGDEFSPTYRTGLLEAKHIDLVIEARPDWEPVLKYAAPELTAS